MVGERVDPALPLEKQVYVYKLIELCQLCASHLILNLKKNYDLALFAFFK